jgi:hypothetical protein
MNKLARLTLVGALALGISASAADRSFGQIYTQCGIGGLLTSPLPSPVKEPLAVISNIVWDLGTTAITSNISSDGTCAGKPERVAAFISNSYDNLEKELAQGEGEYLDTLVSMTKPADQTKEAFVASIRTDFAKVVASNSTDFQKREALYNIVM